MKVRTFAVVLLGLAAALAGFARPAAAQAVQPRYAPAPQHPMDALTVDEVLAAVELLRREGIASEDTRFHDISLHEMPKAAVRTWRRGKPFTRAAALVMRDRARTHEAVVDLSAGRVVARRQVAGAQPGITGAELKSAQRLTAADPRWQEAMRKRGFETFDNIFCAPVSPGRFPGDGAGERRLLKVPCYDNSPGSAHRYGRPIGGVIAVVDVDAGRVLHVIDTGVVEVPQAALKPDRTTRRDPMRPVLAMSPSGANYAITGGSEVLWQNWWFHVRVERRLGPVISLVRARDGERWRDIAYQMSLSEMFVPYMDPDPTWAFRTFLDAGEYGIGYLASNLVPGRDCPFQSTFIDLAIPSDKGGLFKVERGMCIFERNTGEPLWRHSEGAGQRVTSRPAVELVVRTIPTVGNYDYVLDWVFSLNGNIRIRVGATGIDAVKAVPVGSMKDADAAEATRYGTLVAPGTLAVYHDHLLSFRLDLDVDGPGNTVLDSRIVPRRLGDDSARRSVWVLQTQTPQKEGPLDDGGHDRVVRVVNPQRANGLGHDPGIHVEPGHGALSTLGPDDPPQARAAFSANRYWITRRRDGEVHAAGAYPNQSSGGDGLPAYVADRESIVGEDLVLWYTMGFHHVTRVEDWPILPTKWHEVTLRPFNFYDRSPAIDIAPNFARPAAGAPARQ